MSTNLSVEAPVEDQMREALPCYSAGDFPVTRFTRWAFQLWVVCFLFTLVFTLIIYLIDKFMGS